MITLDYAKFDATPVAADPFPHVVVRDFVPPALLALVARTLPTLDKRGSFPISAVRLGPEAQALMAELEGPRLRECVARKFALDLDDAPSMLTLRTRTEARDGQIHTDSRSKRVTALLYLNQSSDTFARRDGCLRLLRGPDNLEDYAVEVPPVDGTLLVFPNSAAAWHGHHTFTGPRFSAQLNYMTTDAKARAEMRRHRLSAFIKKWTMAA